jgi:hypothetical protein
VCTRKPLATTVCPIGTDLVTRSQFPVGGGGGGVGPWALEMAMVVVPSPFQSPVTGR